MQFQGTIKSSSNLPQSDYKSGWTYMIEIAGTYAGKECEPGDLLVCISNYSSAFKNSDWTVIQANINGAVTGPASSTQNNLTAFGGTNGKTIVDSGVALSTVQAAINKLDGIEDGANNYKHPTHTAKSSGLYKIVVDSLGHVNGTTAVTKTDITGLGIPAEDTNTAHAHSAGTGISLTGSGGTSGTTTISLKEAGSTLGGVKSGGDVTIDGGIITVASVGGKTADEIGKVKDVTVNGTSVLEDGVAIIDIDSLANEYTTVSLSYNSTYKYYGFTVVSSDIAFEVYKNGQEIVTQRFVNTDTKQVFVACSASSNGSVVVRKITGAAIPDDEFAVLEAPEVTITEYYDENSPDDGGVTVTVYNGHVQDAQCFIYIKYLDDDYTSTKSSALQVFQSTTHNLSFNLDYYGTYLVKVYLEKDGWRTPVITRTYTV